VCRADGRQRERGSKGGLADHHGGLILFPLFAPPSIIRPSTPMLSHARGFSLGSRPTKPPAQDHEIPENLFKRGAIVAPEIGDGLEVRLQAPQQPDDLNVAMTFGLKPTARPNPVQIAIDIHRL
jgi:hypothetical protein